MSESRVFISYSKEDQPFVQAAVNWLKNSELRSAYIDDPANWGTLGDDVRTIIADKIRQSDTVLLLWSDQAAKSPWVQYEVGIAQALDVPIRVLRAGASRSKLPTGLVKTGAINLEATNITVKVPPLTSCSMHDSSVSTALKDLTQQYERIEQQIQQVNAILTSRHPARSEAIGEIDKERSLSAAARKRIAAEQRRRWADQRKSKGASKERG